MILTCKATDEILVAITRRPSEVGADNGRWFRDRTTVVVSHYRKASFNRLTILPLKELIEGVVPRVKKAHGLG